ncbi:bifunctional 4-hydroxy-2-oxoglutarate aldolase/2-dehydro-3-deoxy-phosphogluconate aldolase [Aquibacillus sp. 3ASR75-11]|uniref:Bifunctional 4-hydroxy-2-oxoglutarate aldolase/2-dehydro-3-deoxy-phosphogluconate aldolase n=1 Tax=Terrihalobacillus insolitus TaxID=2950438 RepID=A0A9X4AM35_9BACI|nr:bifunctional 4-hydroxy-2-oxoglutarate aldolase/2-dehydro-3-deoxy-phosphogluconate aldolase [Terrihalobacillus insolitus]MDC3412206.1 bifunctional 4-hydroxy-2-oxoglutarate aldolase/2-dehydro-3-deoxy-phosphogluconate aldolase [Terrihalobacillus insolitus]MDC3423100.1 bifunctional 4-hydroxy-2-oxoglutarate aldolase/2-dehydro-3-deoxy-phosphogluconate aldolase [Terrihalobacillus insolitus]
MNKEEMIVRLLQAKIIPVLRKVSPAVFMDVVDALSAGGVTAVEITMDSEDASSLIRNVKERYGEKMAVGAGTVMDHADLSEALKAGAEFIVSPILDESVVKGANAEQVPVIPGVLSPTEVVQAIRSGADMVKIFPAGTLGPAYVKNIKGPLGDIPIMCTGGIDAENAADYLKAGAKIVGAGSSLIRKDLIAEQDWSGLTKEVEKWFLQLNHL